MHLEDFPMDAHACPLKFGSCKWPLYSDINLTAWTQTHKKTPSRHTHGFLTCCHYLFQLEVWPRCRSMIRDDSLVTAVLPEELSAKAPLVPLQPCQALQDPARPWQASSAQTCVYPQQQALQYFQSITPAAHCWKLPCSASSLRRHNKK